MERFFYAGGRIWGFFLLFVCFFVDMDVYRCVGMDGWMYIDRCVGMDEYLSVFLYVRTYIYLSIQVCYVMLCYVN